VFCELRALFMVGFVRCVGDSAGRPYLVLHMIIVQARPDSFVVGDIAGRAAHDHRKAILEFTRFRAAWIRRPAKDSNSPMNILLTRQEKTVGAVPHSQKDRVPSSSIIAAAG